MKNSSGSKISIIDDELEMRSMLRDFFTSKGYEVELFESTLKAIEHFSSSSARTDLVISDIRVPGMTGIEFTTQFKLLRPDTPVILITAFGSVETALEAVRAGAFNYVVKPFKLTDLSLFAEIALEHSRLQEENVALRSQIRKSWRLGDQEIIGKSAVMQNVFDLVKRVSGSNANVLITGESGTGKEAIARAIHTLGPRASKPFVAINCSAIPENLLESELFGHKKGAFTGAHESKPGLFEEAQGGTLFLDEIGDLDVSLQAKLLRVLQERKIRAVGGTETKSVDVRVIAATHRDLKKRIKDGQFRDDLFYRLSVIPIEIPPLRERTDDIPPLAEYFLRKYVALNESSVRAFNKDAMKKLVLRPWPGNVRELENVIERAVVLAEASEIKESDILDLKVEKEMSSESGGFGFQDLPTLQELEKRYMQVVLEKTKGRKEKAARILGINRRTLYRKEREYGWVSEDELSGLASVDERL